ncbi:MAG: hypothetical protein KatS3mg118_2735 [Paracoccaceae bacterium]|nr:MAG: zf-HC2 domain-containing protein [Alphaproteobacteria bacterium]GIX14776.1 MAG: hypothetical protein KatS3mg118_2735 [Paracoccaceae bacterium]
MLSCREVAARASALIDGELGLAQRLRMRLHLAMCRGCARFVAQLRLATALIALAGGEEPGQDPSRLAAILDRLGHPEGGDGT